MAKPMTSAAALNTVAADYGKVRLATMDDDSVIANAAKAELTAADFVRPDGKPLNFASTADVTAYFGELGSQRSETDHFNLLCFGAFFLGLAQHGNNKVTSPPSMRQAHIAYREERSAANSGFKLLKPKVFDDYTASLDLFARLGFERGPDWLPVAHWVALNVKGVSYSGRKGKLNRIMNDYDAGVVPTPVQLAVYASKKGDITMKGGARRIARTFATLNDVLADVLATQPQEVQDTFIAMMEQAERFDNMIPKDAKPGKPAAEKKDFRAAYAARKVEGGTTE